MPDNMPMIKRAAEKFSGYCRLRLISNLRKIAAAALALPLMAAQCALSASGPADPAAWDEFIRKHDKASVSRDVPSPVSDDEAVRNGEWPELVRKYGNGFARAGITGENANGGNAQMSASTLAEWYAHMDSEQLLALVTRAFEKNRDLASARAKAAEARAALGISKAASLPWLDSADSWTYSQSSDNSAQKGALSKVTKLGIDASWEIDIFGSQKLRTEAAEANLEASHAALHAAWVTLSSETALNYASFCTLRERIRIAERNLALQEETLSLLKSQYEAGLRDSLAINQASYVAEQTRASIPPLKTAMESTLNALAILTGDTPGSLEHFLDESHDLPRLMKEDEFIGIPAEALRQRPDVRAAEEALAAQIALRKSAERDIYPKFFLMGSIGLEALGGGIFSGDNAGFSFGPRITLPIFHGGAIRKNIQAQTAKEEQLLASYEGTVLAAVAEVRDALAASAQEADRNRSLQLGIGAARAALEIANDKYMSGLTDFNSVIDAQAALLLLEDALAVSDGQMTGNMIRIFKALGGGWKPFYAENLEEAPGGAK